ncbi:MAG: flagellar protein FlaG [Pseudomonadota bacterium]
MRPTDLIANTVVQSAPAKKQAPVNGRDPQAEAQSTVTDADGKNLPAAEEKELGSEVLATAVKITSQNIGADIRIAVNPETQRTVVQVIDRETGELIRQVPSEQATVFVSGNGQPSLRLFDRLV